MTGNRKAVGLLVIVCLTGLIAVSPAKPQSTGTIYINADGSFSDPSKIHRSGNVYSLTGDLYGSAIVVECNHIVLDGRGFKLESGTNAWVSGSVAINLTCSDVTYV